MSEYGTIEQRAEGKGISTGNTCPTAGGCWFCHDDEGPMEFSWEFDTYFHRQCAIAFGVAGANDPVRAYEESDRHD